MSVASELNRIIDSKADIKTQVNIDKDLINQGNNFITNEKINDYDDKIELMQEAYKKFIPIQTISGTEITIDNSNNDKALTSIGLDGNTEQASNPTPDNPQEVKVVTGENTINVVGKNLLDLSQIIIGKAWNDADNPDRAVVYVKCKPSTTYTINIVSLGNFSEAWYFEKDATRTTRTFGNSDITTTYIRTTANNSYYIGLQFNKTNINLSDFTDVKIQIELGSTPTTYEAYKSASYPINLGKNLYNYETIQSVLNGTNNNGQVISQTWTNGSWVGTTITFTPMKLKKDFILSLEIKLSEGATGTFSKVNDGVQNFTEVSKPTISTSWQRYVYKFTPTENYSMSRVFVQMISINGSFEIKNIQIEYGSQVSSYSDYFTPIELNKLETYKDKIYKDSGKWYIRKEIGKVLLNGNEAWIQNSVYNKVYYIENFLTEAITIEPRPMLSDYFTYGGLIISGSGGVENGKFYQWPDMPQRLVVGYDTTSLDTFRTWLRNHNTLIYYPLATATATEITNTNLINQLEAVRLLSGTQSNFSIDADILPTLNINYIGEANPHL